MRVAIRADAGAKTGMGHFARIAPIATALQKSGDVEILLVTNCEGASYIGAFFSARTQVLTLSPEENSPLAAIQAMEARGWNPDVILVDQYGWIKQWEIESAKSNMSLVVLDDLDVACNADLIVRPHGNTRVSGRGLVLAGPSYAPLSPQVINLKSPQRKIPRSRLRLNICFGGADPTQELSKAIEAAASLNHMDIDVLVGPGAQIEPKLLDTVDRSTHIKLHQSPTQSKLVELMRSADLALGAGGVMLWERLHLGLPSLVISTAENQLPQVESMIAKGALVYLGHHSEVDVASIKRGILSLAEDKVLRKKLSVRGPKTVDGQGAWRLAAWIRALRLGFRDVEIEDAKDLLRWRTDERNWHYNWAGSEKPQMESHLTWLRKCLTDPDCIFRIFMQADEPVGVVRFDLSDGCTNAYLSIYLVPAWHEKRIGLPLYFAAEKELRRSHPSVNRIVSKIHAENSASERLHRNAGFEIKVSKFQSDWLDATKEIK
ncbi:GNAT family N-acetyltransferase [Sphingorhabdus buctiana]